MHQTLFPTPCTSDSDVIVVYPEEGAYVQNVGRTC